mmetsp:Transcript_20389/g.51868  ORF Transcript_20389/g.51868 Transcript_20389/m.51868 type:complete len:94 (+) Transcript_20389:909-1190(+)
MGVVNPKSRTRANARRELENTRKRTYQPSARGRVCVRARVRADVGTPQLGAGLQLGLRRVATCSSPSAHSLLQCPEGHCGVSVVYGAVKLDTA